MRLGFKVEESLGRWSFLDALGPCCLKLVFKKNTIHEMCGDMSLHDIKWLNVYVYTV